MAQCRNPEMTQKRKAVTFFACLGILALIAVSLYVAAPVSTSGKHWKNSSFKAEAGGAPITEGEVRQVLSGVQDPEIPLNVLELGLVYKIETKEHRVDMLMTLTSASCGWSTQLLTDIRDKLFAHPGVAELDIAITYDPPWTLDRIDPKALDRLRTQPHSHDGPLAAN